MEYPIVCITSFKWVVSYVHEWYECSKWRFKKDMEKLDKVRKSITMKIKYKDDFL